MGDAMPRDGDTMREVIEQPQESAAKEEALFVARLKSGDEAAFTEVVERCAGRCLAVARRFMRSEDDALDAVQDAFLAMFKNIQKFDEHASLNTWLHRIVVNACLMKLRGKRRRPESSIEAMLPTFLADGHQTHASRRWADNPAGAMEHTELRRLVRAKIDELPEQYRNVLLLRDIEGLDTAAAGAALEMTETAVKTRLHRARQALRGLLDPHMLGDSQ